MTQKEMIETIVSMSNEMQNAFYQNLRNQGITDEEIRVIQSMVFFSKLYSDPTFYKAVCNSMAEQVHAEFTK